MVPGLMHSLGGGIVQQYRVALVKHVLAIVDVGIGGDLVRLRYRCLKVPEIFDGLYVLVCIVSMF
jgi:hypothetical protein